MKQLTLVEYLVKLTIQKAIKEDKHPLEVIFEIHQKIDQKRLMDRQVIEQVASNAVSAN